MEHEKVFLSEYGLIVLAVLKCLLRHNFCKRSPGDIVYPPGEKLSIFTHFAPNKDFLDVYNVEQPSQT